MGKGSKRWNGEREGRKGEGWRERGSFAIPVVLSSPTRQVRREGLTTCGLVTRDGGDHCTNDGVWPSGW